MAVGYELDVPISQLRLMSRNFYALGEYFVQTDPHASWKRLARELHRQGEEEAATAAKQFLPAGVFFSDYTTYVQHEGCESPWLTVCRETSRISTTLDYW